MKPLTGTIQVFNKSSLVNQWTFNSKDAYMKALKYVMDNHGKKRIEVTFESQRF